MLLCDLIKEFCKGNKQFTIFFVFALLCPYPILGTPTIRY